MNENRNPGMMTGVSLLLPITLSTMAIVLLAPILPQLLTEFSHVAGFEYLVPMILTIPALCVAFLSPVAGMMGDYFGRRRLLIWSFAVYAIVGIAPVFLTSLPAILISRVGVGISEALIMVLSTTMIGDYFFGEKRDKWLAAQTAFASLSALLFFNIGGQLGQFGWRTPFWVYGSALLMLVLVVFYTWEPSGGGEADSVDRPPHSSSWEGFPWARLIPILLITVYGSTFFYTVQIQAASGLNLLGMTSPADAGFWTSIASIGVPLGTFIYSRIGRWPVRRLLQIEFSMLALGFMAMSLSTNTASFLIGCFINQLGAGILLPTLLVWAMSLLDFEIRSRGAGLWTGAFSVGQFLSAIVVTFIAQQVGGLFVAFGMLSGGALIAALFALLANFRRGTQKITVNG